MAAKTFTRLGKYEIIEELGRGGFATVYRAHDPMLRRDVALKVLDPLLVRRDPSFVERFFNEARSAARLRHPNIVTIYEVGEEEGSFYLVMDYLPGPTLERIIAEDAPVTVERAIAILGPVAEALDYAHKKGFIHRDIKPSNIILDEDGRPVLTDFGLVRAAQESVVFTTSGMILGTPAYMAPEQAEPNPEEPLDHRCDLYSLGVVAYELLTGRVPFVGPTPLAVLRGHVEKEPPRPRELNPALSEAAEGVLLKALSKKREGRCQSGREFAIALSGAIAEPERWVEFPAKPPAWEKVKPVSAPKEILGVPLITLAIENVHHMAQLACWSQEQVLQGHRGEVWSVAFSSDGKLLASGSADGTVCLWSIPDGRLLRTSGLGESVFSVAFSPDGKFLVSGTGYRARLWRISNWKSLWASKRNRGYVRSVAFRPNGKLIALGSGRIIRLLRASDGQRFGTMEGHEGTVRGVAFSPDGKLLASGSEDGAVWLWRLDGKRLRTLRRHRGPVWSVAFSPDGKLLASGSEDGAVRLWRVSDGKLLRTLKGHKGAVLGVAFSPDGGVLASASKDNTVRLWDVAAGEPLRTLEGHRKSVRSVAFSPEGRLLASGSRDSTVLLWRLELEPFRSGAFSPDGRVLLTAGEGSTALLWDWGARKILHRIATPSWPVACLDWSLDGKLVAVASGDALYLWDIVAWRQVRKMKGHKGAVRAIAFSPDGESLISAGEDGTVRIWPVYVAYSPLVMKGHQGAVLALAIQPSGNLLASAGEDKTIRLWRLPDGTIRDHLKGHRHPVCSLAFNPKGDILASGDRGGGLRLWEVEGREKAQSLSGHNGAVTSLAFSLDGRLLASAGEDEVVRLWDPHRGWELAKLEGHKGRVGFIAWHPSGLFLVSGGDDMSLRFWGVAHRPERAMLD